MKVMEGASFPVSGDNWRKVEVVVDDEDFSRLMTEWGIDSGRASENHRFTALTLLAQGLLLTRQHQMGGLSTEEVQVELVRIRDARARLRAELEASS